MADIRAAVIARLLADDDVTERVGDRVSVDYSAQPDAEPRVVVQLISAEHYHHMTAATGVVIGRIQISAYGASSVALTALMEAVRQRFDGFRGDMEDVSVSMCHLEDERTSHIPPVDASQRATHEIQHDYIMAWSVTVPTFQET